MAVDIRKPDFRLPWLEPLGNHRKLSTLKKSTQNWPLGSCISKKLR